MLANQNITVLGKVTGTQWMLSKYLWKGRKQYFEILLAKQVTEMVKR